MHFKNGVLSEFRKVRSSERLDLLCSLLDACLPFELRFLGTCLEFLGKRDFNELREDERLANNVNHISQFRSLSDENTRRKLVLYVSLLKSSNSDCVNYFSDILAGINMEEVGLVHGTVTNESSLEAMNKLMEELLLLYTIAVNHPAFTIHQKSKFAVILAQLQDEDKKLCAVRRSEKDSDVRFSDFCQRCVGCEGIGESESMKINEEVVLKMPLSGSNQDSIPAPLVCHISPTYSSIEAPSPTLSQGSNVSLSGPPPLQPPPACQVIVSSVCGHTTMTPPVQVQSKTVPVDLISTLSPIGDRPPSQAPSVMPPSMQPAPAHMPPSGTVPSSTSPCLLMNPNMMVPVGVPQGPVSSSSHCIIPTTGIPSGDLNMTKHTMIPPGLLNMSPDSIMHMPFPAPTWGVMVSMPTMGNPTQSPSPTSGPADNANVSGAPVNTRDGPPAAPGTDVVTPLSLSRQTSPSSSRAPTPPRKNQFPKGHAPFHHNPHHHTGPPPLLQQPLQNPPPVISTPATQSQPLPVPPPPPPPGIVPPPPVPNAPPIPLSTPNSVPPPAPPPTALAMHPPPNQPPRPQNCNENWDLVHMPMESYKEEVPKYLPNLQDFSPDELRHMGDEELKDRGMSPEALAQLRSCVNKQQSSNGVTCTNRNPEVGGRNPRHRPSRDWCALTRGGVQVHDGSRPVWRIQGMDGQLHPQLVAMPPCYSGQPCFGVPCSGNKAYRKCGDTVCRQLSQQLRSVRIEDERRPCSNGSSASDSSVGSHSPPDTPVLGGTAVPHHQLWDRGLQRKDSIGGGGGGGNENWQNSTVAPEERLHEDGRPERIEPERNERTEWSERGEERIRNFQPPSGPRNTLNRPRGLSKGNPPGIQTIPRGRSHHGLDKSRREAGPMNGEMTHPGPFSISTPLTVGNNVPYTTPVSSFLPHTSYPTIPTYPTFRHGNYLPPNQPAYPYHHNGEMWNQFPQGPHPSHNFIRHVVAFSPAVPPPKLSCYNCGAQGHGGLECKELTLEEITQQGQFHLDYKPHKESGDCASEK